MASPQIDVWNVFLKFTEEIHFPIGQRSILHKSQTLLIFLEKSYKSAFIITVLKFEENKSVLDWDTLLSLHYPLISCKILFLEDLTM